MTVQEGQKVIDELKAAGNSNEEIAGSLYILFSEGKISREGLESLVNLLGFHLSEEFKQMDPEQQKTEGFEEVGQENEEQPQQNEEPAPASEDEEEKKAMRLFDGNSSDKEEDADEEEKAMKLFGR